MIGRCASVALMTCVALAGAARTLHADDKWIEVRSAHFLVISNDGQSNARTVAWQMEQIRGALAVLWPWAKVDLNRPLTVIALRDEESMKALAPEFWSKRGSVHPGSVWVSGPDQHYLTLRTDQRLEDTQLINPYMTAYFSYVSLVLRQSVAHDLPLWLDRGLAGVLSNTIVRENELLLGPPIPWHVEQIRTSVRLPLPVLLKVTPASPEFRTEDGMGHFDAQAWAFVHFLMFGDKGARSGKLDQFARAVSTGADADTAFRESLGSPDDLQFPLSLYVGRPIFSFAQVKVDVSVKREGFPVRTLPPAESASVRAMFHATMNRPVETGVAIAEARKAGPAPDSFVAEALLLDRDNKKAEAIAAYTRAVEAGSKNSYAHYRLAMLLWPSDADHEGLLRNEKLLAAAVALNIRSANAYAALGEVRSRLGTGDPLGLVRRAIGLEPSEPSYRLAAARVLWREQNFDAALQDAQAALTIATDEQDRRAAQDLIASLEQITSRSAARPAPPSTRAPSQAAAATPSVATPSAATPSAATPSAAATVDTEARPVFRTQEPGEEREEGTLSRIECTTAGAVIFHVQGAKGAIRLTAPRLRDVEFITYRDGLGGNVGCGPLAEAMPVYITSKSAAGTTAGKIVVAIEFLPKSR
ncbi:MAG: hypothetical protein ABJC89_08850 [Acidobacteriota bacterium]